MQPGISRPLARHRAATISEVSYDLALDLSGVDSIPGAVSIYFYRAAGAGDLIVDFRGLSLVSVFANQEVTEDFQWTNGHIRIPEAHLHEGRNSVDVRFVSAVAAAGASVIRFVEAPDPDRTPSAPPDSYLYSLLVPADANQLFPAFDQPDLKASVRLELIAPPSAVVLANSPALDRSGIEDGIWLRFRPTPPISTYLVAFAAGPWESWSDSSGSVPMTVYARRSRAHEVDADTLLTINRRALEWLEDYFRVEYPFEKFDFLLAPAFPFGGMEHPGAVFYNESRFIFREPPTLPERLSRKGTIYHEVAHQWFGDLVTMRWFDDLWLKEGFSTYMAARMQEELDPGTGAWKTFYLRNKPLAYGVDITSGTTPVWQALENLDLAKSNYGPIVYNKAPAILKQLNYLVGEQAFRFGLQEVLRTHAFGNIGWEELLAAMERASGQALDRFGEQYILRAGLPMVETILEPRDGEIASLRLVQRPAVQLAGDPGGWWPGRVQVRLGYSGREDVLLPVTFAGDTTVVTEARGLPIPEYIFANDGDFGYGIFLLDERSAESLKARVGMLEDPLLRTLVWGALWDLVGERRLAPEEFLEVGLRGLPDEEDEQLADFLLARLATVLDRYLPATDSTGYTSIQRRFEELLVQSMDRPDSSYDLRKASLDAFLAAARTPEALRILQDLLAEGRSFDGEPLRQPSRWAAVQTLLAVDHPAADSIYAAEVRRDTTPDGERRAFVAAAARRSADTKAEYFARYLEDPSLNEEWVTASLAAFNHPRHAPLTLPYLGQALERLQWIQQNRRIFFLSQWVNAFIGGHSSREALAVVDDHLLRHPELPIDLRRKVLQARDALARTVEIRESR
jgi:aminopeptidase N